MRRLMAAAVLAAGCGGPPAGAVEGEVRLAGKPLADVLVTFLPASANPPGRAVGRSDAAGLFRLRTEAGREGVAVGPYRVVVEDLSPYSAPRDADGTLLARPPARVPKEYADPSRTPLTAEVRPGPQRIDLDIPPPR